MDTESHTRHTIIVGGGIAGLTAAAYVARAGMPVTVYERSSRLGGMAATEASHGFSFNMGPHALYRGGPAESVLTELGVQYSGRTPVANVALRGGRFFTLPTSAASLVASRLLSPADKVEAGFALASLQKVNAATLETVTLHDWLDHTFKRPRVREYLQALTRVSSFSNDPDYASAGALLRQLQFAAASGVRYVDGGWQSLIEGLRTAARAAGVRIVTGTRVEAIDRGDRVSGIRIAGGVAVPASSVIVAASPRVARDLVAGARETALETWAREAVAVRAACLDVGVSRLPRPRRTFALGVDHPTYLSVHSAWAKLAPDGAGLVSVMKYLRPDDHDASASQAELEAMLDLAQPGWRGVLVERRFLPSMIVSHWSVRSRTGGLPGRPGPAVPGIDGLFVAGDWVGHEGMLSDAAFASGRRAAGLALAEAASASRTMKSMLVAS